MDPTPRPREVENTNLWTECTYGSRNQNTHGKYPQISVLPSLRNPKNKNRVSTPIPGTSLAPLYYFQTLFIHRTFYMRNPERLSCSFLGSSTERWSWPRPFCTYAYEWAHACVFYLLSFSLSLLSARPFEIPYTHKAQKLNGEREATHHTILLKMCGGLSVLHSYSPPTLFQFREHDT